MQIVVAIIVVVILGAGTYVLTQSESDSRDSVVESRQEDTAKNDTEVEVAEEDEDDPADIPLADTSPSATTPEPEPAAPVTQTPVVSTPDPEPEPVVVESEPDPEPVVTSVYADGTYSASADYRSPGGTHSADISITVANDTVTAATFQSDASNSTSKKYINRFADAYQAEVIGQDLESISLSRVGGASLTTKGYNDALALVKSKAAN